MEIWYLAPNSYLIIFSTCPNFKGMKHCQYIFDLIQQLARKWTDEQNKNNTKSKVANIFDVQTKLYDDLKSSFELSIVGIKLENAIEVLWFIETEAWLQKEILLL